MVIEETMTETGLAVKSPQPTLNMDNWLISEFVVTRLLPIVGIRPYPLNELMLMVGTVLWTKPTHIFEWGTHVGKSARILYETTRAMGLNTEIHSIDLPDDVEHEQHPKEKRGIFVRDIPEVKLYAGDGATVALQLYRQKSQESKTPLTPFKPFFYVDGGNPANILEKEIVGIMDTAPEANILLHDTYWRAGWGPGYYQAITNALSSRPQRYCMLSTRTGRPGMTFLYRP